MSTSTSAGVRRSDTVWQKRSDCKANILKRTEHTAKKRLKRCRATDMPTSRWIASDSVDVKCMTSLLTWQSANINFNNVPVRFTVVCRHCMLTLQVFHIRFTVNLIKRHSTRTVLMEVQSLQCCNMAVGWVKGRTSGS